MCLVIPRSVQRLVTPSTRVGPGQVYWVLMHLPSRITVRIKEPSSTDPSVVWLDIGPGSCDLGVYPEGQSPRLDRQALTLLYAAVGHVLQAGASVTSDSMVLALAGLDGQAEPNASRCA